MIKVSELSRIWTHINWHPIPILSTDWPISVQLLKIRNHWITKQRHVCFVVLLMFWQQQKEEKEMQKKIKSGKKFRKMGVKY